MRFRHRMRIMIAGRSGLYCLLVASWASLRIGMLVLGLLLQAAFDGLTGDRPATLSVWSLIALLTAIELARLAMQFGVVITRLEPRMQYHTMASLRVELFQSALESPGPRAGTAAPGETLTAVGEDVDEAGLFVAWSPVTFARWLFAVAALIIMIRTDLVVTAGIVVLFVVILVAMRLLHGRLIAYREATRASGAEVSGVLRETMTAVTAIQAAHAESPVAAHVARLNEARRVAAVREVLFTTLQHQAVGNAAPLGTGLILILISQSAGHGFTIGDLALFTFYLQLLIDTLASLGMFTVRLQRAVVAVDRMSAFLGPDRRFGTLARVDLDRNRVDINGRPPPDVAREVRGPVTPPHVEVRGLTAYYPRSRNGITEASFSLAPGTLTVVTGRMGAGKTSLLRAMLGLMPDGRGDIRYDGQLVADPVGFFVPPRCAYTPQVPRLFTGTIRENILLGLADDGRLADATHRAVLDPDLADMPDGLDTVVGPRGLRLSGGQVQRVAIARMLVRGAGLLVCDDVSSALDPSTDELLWERLLGGPPVTVLAVSHRPAVLRRAEQILVLRGGRIETVGTLDALLAASPNRRSLWRVLIGTPGAE